MKQEMKEETKQKRAKTCAHETGPPSTLLRVVGRSVIVKTSSANEQTHTRHERGRRTKQKRENEAD